MSGSHASVVSCDNLGFTVLGSPPERVNVIAGALEAAMERAGWRRQQIVTDPMYPPTQQMVHGEWTLDVRGRLSQVASHQISPQQWQAACAVVGIGALQIALPPATEVAPGYAMPTAYADPSGSEIGPGLPSWLAPVVIVGVFVLLGWLSFAQSSPVRAAALGGVDYQAHLSADGTSNLPGDYATAQYVQNGHDWETVYAAPTAGGPNAGAFWIGGQYLAGTKLIFGIRVQYVQPEIVDSASEREWVDVHERDISASSHGDWETSEAGVGGRPAHTWEYVDDRGTWHREAWVLGPAESLKFTCRVDHPSPDQLRLAQSRCDSFLASAKLRDKP